MIQYRPVMKAKKGEFDAWAAASASVLGSTHPLFEVVPGDDLLNTLRVAHRGLAKCFTAGAHPLTVDTFPLGHAQPLPGSATGPLLWMAEQLHAGGVPSRPVVRVGDSASVWREAAAAAALHGHGVCLRLGGDPDEDPDPSAASMSLPAMLAALRLAPHDVHLLIDYFEVGDTKTVRRVTPLAAAAVTWAHVSGPWASATVAAGAFPDSISSLPRGVYTSIDRHDAKLWASVAGTPGLPFAPDFGDYGTNHPSIPRGKAYQGPLPNLRQTHDDTWRVHREAKVPPGNAGFGVLCRRVVSDPAFSAAYCWGDEQVDRVARGVNTMGSATQWRAYSTSRHLQVVTDRLATLGAP